MENILVVVAHPDDEVLGCGGTILKYSDKHNFYCIVLGAGVAARPNHTEGQIAELKQQLNLAHLVLGLKESSLYDLPDNQFDKVPLLEVVRKVEQSIARWPQFSIVLTHHPGDLNIDHRITSRAVQTVFRPEPKSKVDALLFFEVLSSTEWDFGFPEFKPTIYVDIAEHIEEKKRAMMVYKNELRKTPHPRSLDGIETLAKRRGQTVGYHYAEAFSAGFLRRILLL